MAEEKKPAAAEAKKRKLPKGRHVSAIKRARQNLKRAERNRVVSSSLKTAVKKVLSAIEKKEKQTAHAALQQATSLLHRAASQGLIHYRNASRHISRLSSRVSKLAA